jgi:CTP synthase
MTSGMVYKEVIEKERALKYKGKCIDADNIRDQIIERISNSAAMNKSDVTIVEIGGTVGDYQNIMFIEAARIFKLRHPDDVVFVMVSYLPVPGTLGEMKSKPTQNAVHQLQSYGVQADFIVARSVVPLDAKRKEKIAYSCNVPIENVISAPDIDSIYDVPLNFERDKIGDMIERQLHLQKRSTDLSDWRGFVTRTKSAKSGGKEVHIAVVGKYFDTGDFVLADAYVSVIEALKFSSYSLGVKPVLHWVSSKKFESSIKESVSENEIAKRLEKTFKDMDGILVPGGFGESGIEGKIAVIKYARENGVPYFGLCYGMQLLVIEYARHIAGLTGAQTSEIDAQAEHVVIDIMEHQKKLLSEGKYGASMRLGGYPCVLKEGSVADSAYSKAGWVNGSSQSAKNAKKHSGSSINGKSRGHMIIERHRHRYEVNPRYVDQLRNAGLVFSGTSPDGMLMEIAELPRGKGKNKHPFFLGTQFHPEFLARPLDPHPLFTEFIKASSANRTR